jgi:hypothetical protein
VNKILRQGDVLLVPVEAITRKNFRTKEAFDNAKSLLNADLCQKKDNILAYGEATGHHHIIKGYVIVREEVSDKAVNDRGQIVEVMEDAKLIHTSGDRPDHDVLVVPIGKYLRVVQKQRDPFAGWITVRD